MASKGYTSKTIVEDYILQDIISSFNSRIDGWIEGVEKFIDNLTGRNFIADSAATTRLFDGDNEQDLLIDDAVEVTVVEQGNDDYGNSFNTISASGTDRYFLDPENYSVKGFPITKITLRSRVWPAGKQNNRITAKWGYSVAVPSDIQFAATVLVGGILNQHRGGGDKIKQEKIGNYTVAYDINDADALADYKEALRILDSYKKYLV